MHSNDGRDGLLSGGRMLDRSLLLKGTNTNMTPDQARFLITITQVFL